MLPLLVSLHKMSVAWKAFPYHNAIHIPVKPHHISSFSFDRYRYARVWSEIMFRTISGAELGVKHGLRIDITRRKFGIYIYLENNIRT